MICARTYLPIRHTRFGRCLTLLAVKKGTIPIVLGLLMLAGSVSYLDRATPVASLFSFAFAAVTLLWGISDKVIARFPTD